MKSFVSEHTSAELVRLKKEYEDTKKELASLQDKYKGSTPAMQETLDKLMMIDLHYQSQVKTLVAKLEYIQAAYEEMRYKADIEQARGEKCYYDALMDMMDD
jgi:flagellar biosynthesis chaperone FliJ